MTNKLEECSQKADHGQSDLRESIVKLSELLLEMIKIQKNMETRLIEIEKYQGMDGFEIALRKAREDDEFENPDYRLDDYI